MRFLPVFLENTMAQTAISVLMIVQSYYLNDPRVRREAESLAEAGYQVDVISLRGVDGLLEQTVNGVRIFGIALGRKHGNVMRYVYEYGVFLVCAAFLAAWLHVKEHYHVVQVHNLPDTLAIAAILPQLLGARVVFDAHEVMPEALQIKYGWPESSWKFRISIAIERYCLNLAHHVLTIHEPMRQLLIQGRGVPPKK